MMPPQTLTPESLLLGLLGALLGIQSALYYVAAGVAASAVAVFVRALQEYQADRQFRKVEAAREERAAELAQKAIRAVESMEPARR